MDSGARVPLASRKSTNRVPIYHRFLLFKYADHLPVYRKARSIGCMAGVLNRAITTPVLNGPGVAPGFARALPRRWRSMWT